MSRSRWGGFKRGKKIFSNWANLSAPSATIEETPATVQDFDYTQAQGIWNLRSTTQFSKKNDSTFASSYTTGLSDSLLQTTGDLDAWTQKTVDISAYAGATVRLVFEYTMIGSVFTADLQLDSIALDGTTYSFENTGESFETTTTDTAIYAGASWSSLAVGTTNGRFNVDSGGTGSNGTGRTDAVSGSYYVYAESSSPANVSGFKFWLRSPQVTLSGSPTLTYYEARTGTSLGNLDVRLDVIA